MPNRLYSATSRSAMSLRLTMRLSRKADPSPSVGRGWLMSAVPRAVRSEPNIEGAVVRTGQSGKFAVLLDDATC